MGDEVIELVRDGALDSFSVGFSPKDERRLPDGTVARVEVKLNEVSVVVSPAYAGALIAGRPPPRTFLAATLNGEWPYLNEGSHDH